jgi:hypothetical protein
MPARVMFMHNGTAWPYATSSLQIAPWICVYKQDVPVSNWHMAMRCILSESLAAAALWCSMQPHSGCKCLAVVLQLTVAKVQVDDGLCPVCRRRTT